jgi:TP901 family phage tail tape measure protein
MRALKQSADLAAVGGANLEETTNALAGAWRSGVKGAGDFHTAVATVNAIIGAGNMKMEDFNAALGTGILASARSFGVSLKSVGSALALMTDEGIPASDAATRLRMSLSLLGAPSRIAEKQLATIGLSGLKLANAMRGPGGLVAAIGLLKQHLDASGLSASKQAQLLSRAFGGGRSNSAILTMLNNYDTLRRKQDQVTGSMGKFDGAVKTQRKTAEAQFKLLQSTLDVMAVKIGTTLLPPVTSFLGWLNKGGHIVPILAAAMAGLTAVIVAQAVAWAATPIGAITLGITALIAVIIELKQHWAAVSKWWREHQLAVHVIAALFGPIGILISLIMDIATHWRQTVHITATVLQTMWSVVSRVFGDILGAAAHAFGWVPGLGPKLRTAEAAFKRFAAQVNADLQSIRDRTISVAVAVTGAPGHELPHHRPVRGAGGGMVFGPGTGTSDSVPAMLSRGEFVMSAAAVAKYGASMMGAINAGRFASGGIVMPRTAPAATGQFAAGGPVTVQAGNTRGGDGAAQFTGNLYLDSGELLGIVRGEMRERDRSLKRRVTSGAGQAL